MSKIIVLQHVPYEILGTMDPLFKQQRIRIKYVNFGRYPNEQPSLEGYAGLVILGGPMNVDQIDEFPHLATEIELIKEAMSKKMPILGVCLGAQLIAKACGAKVGKNGCKEIGWYDVMPTEEGRKDPLLKHFNSSEKIFQWHGDTFEIPENAVKLATGNTCPNQAYRIGDNIYGFQFHLEVDEPLVERWLSVPRHLEELEALKGVIDPAQIERDIPKYIDHSKHLSLKVFMEFARLLGKPHPEVKLPSR